LFYVFVLCFMLMYACVLNFSMYVSCVFDFIVLLPIGVIKNISLWIISLPIGQTAAKIRHIMTIFRFFKMAAILLLGFAIRVFGPHSKSICWQLSLCKIWLNSVHAVVSTIDTSFSIVRVRLEMCIHAPKIVFGVFYKTLHFRRSDPQNACKYL